ncbi:MAG: rhodanese-like domain-containing protein [Candidatus Babeliales bacterium]
MNTMRSSLLVLLFVLPSCTWWGQTKSEPMSGLIVVNVLDSEYHSDCRIAGSINVTIEQLAEKSANWQKDSQVVFYCTNYWCTSSGYAADQLIKSGFKNIYAYEGGIAEWHQKGYPTDGPCQKSYLKKEVKPFADEEESKGYTIITAEELYKKMVDNKLIAAGKK